MDNQEILKKIEAQEVKIDAIFKSVEKTRKYFLTMIWITVLGVVLPMIGLAFIIPSFLSNYTSALGGFEDSSNTNILDSLTELGL